MRGQSVGITGVGYILIKLHNITFDINYKPTYVAGKKLFLNYNGRALLVR